MVDPELARTNNFIMPCIQIFCLLLQILMGISSKFHDSYIFTFCFIIQTNYHFLWFIQQAKNHICTYDKNFVSKTDHCLINYLFINCIYILNSSFSIFRYIMVQMAIYLRGNYVFQELDCSFIDLLINFYGCFYYYFYFNVIIFC